MMEDTSEAHVIESVEVRFEKLTPLTPFYGRVTARIPASEAMGLPFWLVTFAEHGVFIAANLPCDRQDLIAEARRFSDAFYSMLRGGGSGTNVGEAVRCAEAMVAFLERLMNMKVAGELLAHLPPSTFLHMIDETNRFIMIATHPELCIEPLGAKETVRTPLVNLLDAEHFWLGDQSEHSEMLLQAVDPVHLRYMEETHGWEHLLRHLGNEAIRLKRMAEAMPPRMAAACRMTRDAVGATIGKRDFAWDTFEMRNSNQLLGTQPALLAYHMARESEHARLVMEALAGERP